MKINTAICMILLLFFTVAICQRTFAATIYFAQVADGGGTVTTITIMNITIAPIQGVLKFFTQDGRPRSITMNGATGSAFAVTIPAQGSVRYRSSNTGPTVSGWASFETTGIVQGVAVFELVGPGGSPDSIPAEAAGVIATSGGQKFVLPVDVDASETTAFALANVTDAPLTVQLSLLDESGSTKASTLIQDLNPLTSLGQFSGFVSSVFPAIQLLGGQFKGTLVAEIYGNGTFAATGLCFSGDMRTFWAIPVAYLTPAF